MKRRILVCVSMLIILVTPLHAEDTMDFNFFSDSEPYFWIKDEQPQGILVDIINEAVQERMGIPAKCSGYPWKRAQNYVRNGKADALITVCEYRKDWTVSGEETVFLLEMKIFVKNGGSKFSQLKKVRTLEELKPFNLISYIGDGWAKKNLIEKNFNVHLVAKQEIIYRMLDAGRGDANANGVHIGRYMIKKLGLKDKITELPVVIESLPFKLCVGKKSPYVKVIPEFDETVRQMKQDGTMQKIFDKYQ
jgi:polar amino acid transport system substrate-binding protein